MLKAAERRGCGHISLIVCRKCRRARESGERNKLPLSKRGRTCVPHGDFRESTAKFAG